MELNRKFYEEYSRTTLKRKGTVVNAANQDDNMLLQDGSLSDVNHAFMSHRKSTQKYRSQFHIDEKIPQRIN